MPGPGRGLGPEWLGEERDRPWAEPNEWALSVVAAGASESSGAPTGSSRRREPRRASGVSEVYAYCCQSRCPSRSCRLRVGAAGVLGDYRPSERFRLGLKLGGQAALGDRLRSSLRTTSCRIGNLGFVPLYSSSNPREYVRVSSNTHALLCRLAFESFKSSSVTAAVVGVTPVVALPALALQPPRPLELSPRDQT